ncbi:hypothetical protein M422DRAFT_240293 [Sphaerobolus stellatus SS14]|nr:hypothetical protein M422DRAFT_240293 [Sphaerobolus stellatus SS14]
MDETLDHLQETWPKLGQYITDIGDERNALEKELTEEKSNNDLLNKIKIMETQLTSLQPSQQSSDRSMTVTSPTDTYSSDIGPHPLASPEKWTYSQKHARKLNKNSSFRNKVLKPDERPNHWVPKRD